MRNPGGDQPYRVIETPSGQFTDNWVEAVRLGYLDPEQADNDFEWLRLAMTRDPYIGTQMLGDLWVVEYRQLGREVLFWYHINEDDRLVELTAVSWRRV